MTHPHWQAFLRATAFALLACFACATSAVTLPNLYEIAQPVSGSRDAAFEEALKTVVVRVSGRRDAAARLGAELASPRKYVQRFGFTADNVLQVGFDSVSVDKLLSDAGLPIWGRERPATLVMLGVEEPDGSTRWLTSQSAGAERAAIERAASERGLPLVWAAMDAQDRGQASGDPSTAAAGLSATAERYGANATLVGRLRGGAVRWALVSSEGVSEATGGLADGVHLAADAFAELFAATGSSLTPVVIEVAGVSNLDAYASTMNYLESLTLVRNVGVEQMAGDILRLRLAIRGDAETLRRAIALDNRLLPQSQAEPGAAGERLSFRFNR